VPDLTRDDATPDDADPRTRTLSGTASAEIDRRTVSVTPAREAQPAGEGRSIPAAGTTIGGKYRVEGVLGEGGMGVVLAATHARLGRKVALKILRPDVRTDTRALRLVREAEATGRLRSPYVAALLDVEEPAGQPPYLVLERLEGETLAARIRRDGALPVAEAADVLVQAGLGLAAAHAAGIVHRDVKPSNLFLARGEGGERVVKVLDFGVAKSVLAADPTLTAEATAVGSPAYMSPEQTRGDADVDVRTDIWALGVTLYQALSGELPFGTGSSHAVAARIVADAPRPLATLRPGLPRGLLRLVASCLEKDPRGRPGRRQGGAPDRPRERSGLRPHVRGRGDPDHAHRLGGRPLDRGRRAVARPLW
jgi:serine/threonine-protein kinase